MKRMILGACIGLSFLVVPIRAAGQQGLGAIAGIVRDDSGGVLPGVSVEVTSPVLIEKVRSAVSDGTGQYKILNLPVGTYTVSFTLTGFSTSVHEGIDLGANFTASVSAVLKVGTLAETVTVSADSPVVDVQSSATVRALPASTFKEIPNAGTWTQMAALITGVNTNIPDVGGTSGDTVAATLTTHGSSLLEQNQLIDGLKIGNLQVAGARTNMSVSPLMFEEVSVQLSGGSGAGNGVALNAIPKSGGNTFTGTALWNGSANGLQTNNLTDRLAALGLTSSNTLRKMQDINGALGGPIARDRVWFFTTARYYTSQGNLAGLYFPVDPTSLRRTEDRSRPGYSQTSFTDINGRITFAMTPRQKLSGYYQFESKCECWWVINSAVSPEATLEAKWPITLAQVSYSNVLTNRLLLESGFNLGNSSYTLYPRDGLTPSPLIRIVEQGGAVAAPITYRAPGNSNNDTLKQWYGRVALSYTTGANSLKGGIEYEGGLKIVRGDNSNGFIQYRTRDSIPNQLTLLAPTAGYRTSEDYALGLFVQDQWTVNRVSVNAGLRVDLQRESVDPWTAGPSHWLPSRSTSYPGIDGVVNWKDVNPRVGVTYDLFGNGKTALKASASRGVLPDGLNLALLNSFAQTLTTSVARVWTDLNEDFVPNCDQLNPLANGECGPYLNSTFGSAVPGTTYDPAVLSGWGVRQYNWEFFLGVQQELLPRVALNLGYYRRISGNFTVTDNIRTSASDYTPYSVVVPSDARLTNAGATITGLYDVAPGLVSSIQNRVTFASNFGDQYDHWNGFDVSIDARPGSGLLLQSGVSTGRQSTDNCEVGAKVPESMSVFGVWTPLQYCHQSTGWVAQYKGLAAYQLPWAGIRLSAGFQSVKGPQIFGQVIYTGAQIAPSLGRPFSSGPVGQAIVNVTQPGTNYNDRLTQLDLRATKIVKVGKAKIDLNVDVFNAFNSDAILSQTNIYGAAWLKPTSIVQARFVKFGVRVDF